MSHGMRWPSENSVLGTTARISSSTSGGVESRHATAQEDRPRVGSALPVTAAAQSTTGQPCAHRAGVAPGPLTPNDGSRPKATGKYPSTIYPLVGLCKAAGLPIPVPEYEFHPTRKWRFDYAIPQWKVAIEIEGAIWQRGGGGHSHPMGIVRDMEKYNAAAVQGWRVLRYAPEDLNNALVDLRAL